MLKTLVVDDDVFIYTHLKKMIDWEGAGFYLCGFAGNGWDAVRMIEAEHPEVVITDMNMPGLNGIGLIEHLHQTWPAIKVIALSAYDDFQFVRESLKLGACDYVLKHTLTPELLLNMLQSVRQNLSQKQADRRLAEQWFAGKMALRQNFLRSLVIKGINSLEEAEKQIELFSLDVGVRNLLAVAGEIDDYAALAEKYTRDELPQLLKSLEEIILEILKDTEKSVFAMLEDGRFVILLSVDGINSKLSVFNLGLAVLTRIRASVKRYLNLTVCFAFDRISPDLSRVYDDYRKAERLLSRKFYEGKDRIFHDLRDGDWNSNAPVLGIEDEKNILNAVIALNRQRLSGYIEALFERIRKQQPNPGMTRLTLVTLLNIASKAASNANLPATAIFPDHRDLYEQLDKLETAFETKDWLLALYHRLMDHLELFSLKNTDDAVIRKAMEFMMRNYADDLFLENIAEYAGVNGSYLSRKFKKECGKGVIEYLNGLRVARAKWLIAAGGKTVKSIADEVGFKNYNYFFKVFKDNVGMTPLEYEKACFMGRKEMFKGGSDETGQTLN